MNFIKLIFALFLFSNVICAMESDKSKIHKLNRSAENSNCFLLDSRLPIEIIVLIGDHLLELESDQVKAIKNHLNFAHVLCCDKRCGQDIRKTKEEYLKFFAKQISPFVLAGKLKIDLSEHWKQEFKKIVINHELKRRLISQEDLDECLKKHNQENRNGLILDLVGNKKDDSTIGLLALLQADVNADSKNEFGSTPLMLAVRQNDEDLVKLLINVGADHKIWNSNNETAYLLAENKEMQALLESLGVKEVPTIMKIIANETSMTMKLAIGYLFLASFTSFVMACYYDGFVPAFLVLFGTIFVFIIFR